MSSVHRDMWVVPLRMGDTFEEENQERIKIPERRGGSFKQGPLTEEESWMRRKTPLGTHEDVEVNNHREERDKQNV